MTDEEIRSAIMSKLTIGVPIAGKALGLSRISTYAAVKRGDLPSIRIMGSRIEIPTAPLRKILGIDGRDGMPSEQTA